MNSFNRQFIGCFNIFRKGLGKIKEFMGGVGVPTTGAEVSLRKLMTPNPNVEAKLPVRKIEDFPMMVYYVDYNGKYLKCL
jgi:putative transposase